jgi:glycosyltransferase involved in cell wall biosynthesis
MNRVSVIIPCYNHAATVGKTLASLFAQTFKDIEIIVVDDGSTDDVGAALAPWKDRIRLVRQPNSGGPVARNRGFRESSGESVMFLDADAILREDAIEKMRSALESHPEAAYAYASCVIGWKRFRLWPFDAARLRRHNYIHTGSLIRREAFTRFDESLKRFQDWDLWLTMLEQGKVGVWVPETLFRFRDARRKGISSWLPSFMYAIPWKRLGWMPRRVREYETAAEVIRRKHRLTA